MRIVLCLCLSLLSTPLSSAFSVGDDGDKRAGKLVETTEVKRTEPKGPKHPSLRFLKDHRVFIRARLDMLRTQTTRVRTDDAELLDERFLLLSELAAAIAPPRVIPSAQNTRLPLNASCWPASPSWESWKTN